MFKRYQRLIRYTLYKGLFKNTDIRQNKSHKKNYKTLNNINYNIYDVLTPNINKEYYKNINKKN